MKKFFARNIAAVLIVLSAGVLLSSCLKDNNNDDGQDIPAAGVMAFNLAPDQQAIEIRLSGSSLTQGPLAYTSYNGNYQRIYTGDRQIQAFGYPATTPLTSLNYNFEQDKVYSLFVVGADSSYKNVVALDDVDSTLITSGKAYVRYINAIPDSVNTPTVTVTAGGTSITDEPANFTHVSSFKAVDAGDVIVAVKNSNNLDVNRTITLQANKAYTVLLLGIPGATDETTKPQIRFIENGSVTDSTGQ